MQRLFKWVQSTGYATTHLVHETAQLLVSWHRAWGVLHQIAARTSRRHAKRRAVLSLAIATFSAAGFHALIKQRQLELSPSIVNLSIPWMSLKSAGQSFGD